MQKINITMDIQIKRYEKSDEAALFDLIRSEGEEWKDYTHSDRAVEKFKNALNNSIVYVMYSNNTLCGFVRAKDDDGYGIYIYDLLVNENYRGNSYGRLMIEQICKDYNGEIFVLSDVDGYYKKQGYKKEGTVFTIRG